MALKAKVDGGFERINETIVGIDTNGNNYIGTIPLGYRGATVHVTVNGGSATGLTVGHATNATKGGSSPTVIEYENGAITATGGDTSINSGTGVDLYLVVAGASSLSADVEVDMFA